MWYKDPRERGYAGYRAPLDKTYGNVFVKKDTPLCYTCLGIVYPKSVTLKVRQEHFILAEVQRLLPKLEHWFEEWDCPVAGGCSLKRPDMLWEMPRFYLHLEVDEGGDRHEDDRERLKEIHRSMGMHRPGVVIRINAEGMLTQKKHGGGERMWTATKRFSEGMKEVVTFIEDTVLKPMGTEAMGIPECCVKGEVCVHKLLFEKKPGTHRVCRRQLAREKREAQRSTREVAGALAAMVTSIERHAAATAAEEANSA